MQLYPKDALEKLEFEKILTLLQNFCQLDAAKKLSLRLKHLRILSKFVFGCIKVKNIN